LFLLSLVASETEQKVLFEKQGRKSRFRNKEERNAWLKTEMDTLRASIKDKTRHVRF
jgi:hypothetical protein